MSGVDRLDSAVNKFDKILVKVLSCSQPKLKVTTLSFLKISLEEYKLNVGSN